MIEEKAIRITRRGLERREQIRKIAGTLFLEHGYEGVSVDEIMRQAGGSKTNLYNHFGDKEGLFMAVISQMSETFTRDIKDLDVSALPLKEGLERLGRQLLLVLMEEHHVAFQRLVIAESGRFPAIAKTWFEKGPQMARHYLSKAIIPHIESGFLRQGDPEIMARHFHDMIVENLLSLALLGQVIDEAVQHKAVEDALQTLLCGWAARPD
ncbi:TetR/AcrR family transcriptional regulator [Pseudochrobactrum sp. sp1633]|uniref:TetR/AcrR family transcriptional regulator n=1 Tax=Pseudochrobactrum sp. sp1633 TaxID=3036706 RepID=UPI0025A5217A|nr:TetR/AcrR family transcriptional regulator [Pseudochrobactrum sp. sp1633]MDM8344406.1 TetR/AcrR family transcriptional regulator [Pseudochrobactrum sp. sp1633]HWD14462.1 TetR/AcrR family transcriptional regulator [Pseudochrobactrum sp.]